MKWIIATAVGCMTLSLAHFLQLPWYFDGLLLFLIGLIFHRKWWGALISGGVATSLVWGIHIHFLMAAGSDLPERIAQLFGLEYGAQLYWTVVLFGALWGGLASIAGWSLSAVWVKRKTRKFKR